LALRRHLLKYNLVDAAVVGGRGGLKALVERYLVECGRERQNPKFLLTKRTQLAKLVEEAGDCPPRQLKPEHLRAVMRKVLDAGRSPRTANQHRMIAIGFATWLLEQHYLDEHPFKRVPKASEEVDRRRVRRAATPEELQRLLATAPRRRADVYLALVYTGLRRGELRQMTWADVDFEAATIEVRAEVSKSAKAAVLPLHPRLAEMLRARKPKRAADTARWFSSLPNTKTFYRDLEAAGVLKLDAAGRILDVHALRGTLATQLARQGVPMPTVQRLLRHAHIETTAKYYTHLDLEDLRQGLNHLPSKPQAAA
jgi:integrase